LRERQFYLKLPRKKSDDMNAVAPDKNEKSIRSGGSAAAISDNNQNMLLNNRQSIQDFT